MYERLSTCPICDSTSFNNHLVVEDHAVSNESFVLVDCQQCHLLFANPRPHQQEISKYYQSQDYISHAGKWRSPMDVVYGWARHYMLARKERWLREFQPNPGDLLDVGCGVGSFLKFCESRDWKVQGIEPNTKAAAIARQKQLTINESLDAISQKFDAITLWHVLEHIHDLKSTLNTLKYALRKDGHLFIAVPNHRSFDARSYGDHWAGYDVPRHLYHFDQSNIKQLASQLKMKLVKTIPLKLDAYYVSILSEKYKNGSIFKGLLNGFKSNQWAKQNQNEYSSLTYVLRK